MGGTGGRRERRSGFCLLRRICCEIGGKVVGTVSPREGRMQWGPRAWGHREEGRVKEEWGFHRSGGSAVCCLQRSRGSRGDAEKLQGWGFGRCGEGGEAGGLQRGSPPWGVPARLLPPAAGVTEPESGSFLAHKVDHHPRPSPHRLIQSPGPSRGPPTAPSLRPDANLKRGRRRASLRSPAFPETVSRPL